MHTLLQLLDTVFEAGDLFLQVCSIFVFVNNLINFLRFLSAVNKPILADTKLPECACQAVKTPHAAVQFKALAILRLLVQGQGKTPEI